MSDFGAEREAKGSFYNCTTMSAQQVKTLALARGVTGIACFLLCVVTMALMVGRRETRAALMKSTQTRLLAYLFLSTTVYLGVLGIHTGHYWNYAGNKTVHRHKWQVNGTYGSIITCTVHVALLHICPAYACTDTLM